MAKVFTGRIALPLDKFMEYLRLMEEDEKERDPFRQKLLQLNEEFYQYLLLKFSEKTADRQNVKACRQLNLLMVKDSPESLKAWSLVLFQ